MLDLGTLGGTESSGYSINDSGQVVGYAEDSGNVRHAFLYSGGVMTNLNSLLPGGSGWTLQYAYSINNNGDIVGHGIHDGLTRAFLMTQVADETVPEPGTVLIWSMLASVVVVGTTIRRLTPCIAPV